MKRVLLIPLFLVSRLFAQSHVVDTVGNTVIHIDSLIGFGTDFDKSPWDLLWGPDQKLWYTAGNNLCRYDTGSHQSDTLFTRTGPNGNYFLSVAVHPNFIDSPFVYITMDTSTSYYAGSNHNMLYRYRYSPSGDSLNNETAILYWFHPGEHSGGRIVAGHDHYLYVTTSEYWPGSDSLENLSGKILRVNLDGSIPAGNTNGYGFTYGHRNPQGIVQVPNGNIIISELGQQIDELNWIQQDHNYGWPVYDGDFCINIIPDSCTSPTFTYEHPIDTAIRPPSGIDYYDHPAIPEFQGCILQAILSFGGIQGGIVASKLNGAMNDIVSDVHYFKGEYLRFRDVCVSPDGKVYAITNDRQSPVIRVFYNPNSYAGIEENTIQQLSLYPNPAAYTINIRSAVPVGVWSIYSIEGKKEMSGICNAKTGSIDISALTPGMYFFSSRNGVLRFVKL